MSINSYVSNSISFSILTNVGILGMSCLPEVGIYRNLLSIRGFCAALCLRNERVQNTQSHKGYVTNGRLVLNSQISNTFLQQRQNKPF